MIKLTNGDFVVKGPVLTPVMRDADAAIVTFYHKAPILRMDPPGMMIRMNTRIRDQGREGLPAVLTYFHLVVDIVDAIFVLRIDADILEIEWPIGYPSRV